MSEQQEARPAVKEEWHLVRSRRDARAWRNKQFQQETSILLPTNVDELTKLDVAQPRQRVRKSNRAQVDFARSLPVAILDVKCNLPLLLSDPMGQLYQRMQGHLYNSDQLANWDEKTDAWYRIRARARGEIHFYEADSHRELRFGVWPEDKTVMGFVLDTSQGQDPRARCRGFICLRLAKP